MTLMLPSVDIDESYSQTCSADVARPMCCSSAHVFHNALEISHWVRQLRWCLLAIRNKYSERRFWDIVVLEGHSITANGFDDRMIKRGG